MSVRRANGGRPRHRGRRYLTFRLREAQSSIGKHPPISDPQLLPAGYFAATSGASLFAAAAVPRARAGAVARTMPSPSFT